MLLPNRVRNGPHQMPEDMAAHALSPCTIPAAFDPYMLIIDDYPPGQRLLNELSRVVGLRTYTSSCINTLPHAILTQPVAGIIIDADCHGDSWIDFVRIMRNKDNETAPVPVFMLSSVSRTARDNSLSEIGVTAVLSKPICVSDFFAALDRWVSPRIEAMRLVWQVCQPQPVDQQALSFG
jgi:CheY-like chemotaxis protein